MSQLSEIRSDMQDNLPTDYHSSLLTSDKKDELINKFQNRLCRLHNFEFLKQEVTQDTTDEQQVYAIPTAGDSNWTELNSATVLKFKEELDCWLINSDSYRVPLTKSFKKQIQDDPRFKDSSDLGTPSHWCIDQNYLWLFEKPDHDSNSDTAWVIHLVFYGYLADLSGDTDTNWITNNHPELLEWGGTALCFEMGQDYEQAAYWKNKAISLFMELRDADTAQKVSAMEEGMKPASGQSLGDHTYGSSRPSLTAHYE